MNTDNTNNNNKLDPNVQAVVNALSDSSRFQASYVKQKNNYDSGRLSPYILNEGVYDATTIPSDDDEELKMSKMLVKRPSDEENIVENIVEFVYENNRLVHVDASVEFINELPGLEVIEKYRGAEYINERRFIPVKPKPPKVTPITKPKPPGKPPTKPPGKPPAAPPAAPPGKPPTKPPGKPPAAPPGKPPTTPPGKPPTKPPAAPPGKPPTKPPAAPPPKTGIDKFKDALKIGIGGIGGYLAGTLLPMVPDYLSNLINKPDKPPSPTPAPAPAPSPEPEPTPGPTEPTEPTEPTGPTGPTGPTPGQAPGEGGQDQKTPKITFRIKDNSRSNPKEVGRSQFEKEYKSGGFGGKGIDDLDFKFKIKRDGQSVEIGKGDKDYDKFLQQYKQMQGAVYEALILNNAQLRDDGWYFDNELIESVETYYQPKPFESPYYYDSTGHLRVMSRDQIAEFSLAETVVEKIIQDYDNVKLLFESHGYDYDQLIEKLDKVGKEDKDLDNDGDSDSSDDYLANRRKVIAAKIKGRIDEIAPLVAAGARYALPRLAAAAGRTQIGKKIKNELSSKVGDVAGEAAAEKLSDIVNEETIAESKVFPWRR